MVSLYPIRVRPLRLSDLDEIMEIEPEAYGSHHWSRQSFITELTNVAGSYFGAECIESGRLLGYTGYWLIADEAHVTTLAVHPEFRRKSVAERMLINSIVEARKDGAHWLTLEVRESNEAAKKLYFKYGFRRLGVRRKYYQDNKEDALVLWTDRLTESAFISRVQNNMIDLGLNQDEQNETLLVLNGEIPSINKATA
ncbi:MAG: ribosomal protein S18-alanine N-acetyltransferase [Cyanobacteria bacterium]|nr:ribosomal protein S18-alanine N-acetyltransferase [Cyanobacteriota bacterium]